MEVQLAGTEAFPTAGLSPVDRGGSGFLSMVIGVRNHLNKPATLWVGEKNQEEGCSCRLLKSGQIQGTPIRVTRHEDWGLSRKKK
jgi:hypothetical protein